MYNSKLPIYICQLPRDLFAIINSSSSKIFMEYCVFSLASFPVFIPSLPGSDCSLHSLLYLYSPVIH